MINEKLLDEAILAVYKQRLMQDMRNHIVYGDKDLGVIYAMYQRKVKERKDKVAAVVIVVGLLAVAAGFSLGHLLRAAQ